MIQKYNDKTLFHSVGFNLAKLYSILKYGLLSEEAAIRENVSVARNHLGSNLSDTISAVRSIYVNDNYDFAYNKYIAKGISISMEVDEKDYIYDKKERIINHIDEVLIKDKVDKSLFKSIIIPEEYLDYDLEDLPMFNLSSTSYDNIKNNCDLLIEYMKSLNYCINIEEYQLLLKELGLTIKVLSKNPDDETRENFEEIKCALSEFIANNLKQTFCRALNKPEATLEEMVEYINNQTLNLPIYIKKYKNNQR